jgi:polar amino acid transport system substrate-binding protein
LDEKRRLELLVQSRTDKLENELTNRKQAEVALRERDVQLLQADKMSSLGRIVSGVAHEINNPNNFIMLNAPLLRNTLSNKTVDLRLSIGETPVRIHGNSQRLEQVVINLLQNSCDAISEDSKRSIEVSLDTSPEDRILLCICDAGCGIAPRDLPHITEPFFTTKRSSGGTGLGLSISSKIVAEHGGQLLFESEEGKGTTVRLVLPK